MENREIAHLEHEQLFSEVTALVREYVIRNKDKSTKVIIMTNQLIN